MRYSSMKLKISRKLSKKNYASISNSIHFSQISPVCRNTTRLLQCHPYVANITRLFQISPVCRNYILSIKKIIQLSTLLTQMHIRCK